MVRAGWRVMSFLRAAHAPDGVATRARSASRAGLPCVDAEVLLEDSSGCAMAARIVSGVPLEDRPSKPANFLQSNGLAGAWNLIPFMLPSMRLSSERAAQ